jgi:hypothetical protein
VAPLPRFHTVVSELCDPSSELRLLAAKLQEELGDQATKLTGFQLVEGHSRG